MKRRAAVAAPARANPHPDLILPANHEPRNGLIHHSGSVDGRGEVQVLCALVGANVSDLRGRE